MIVTRRIPLLQYDHHVSGIAVDFYYPNLSQDGAVNSQHCAHKDNFECVSIDEVTMQNRGSVISAIAIIVVALALIVRLVVPSINWWALILIIPIAMFIWKSFSTWASARRTAFVFIQVALILITILIAFFYQPLWGIIYIPILLIVGLTGLLSAISKQ